MSVFSPLSDEDVVKDAAVNGDDARLSLTTQLLPQSSSRVTYLLPFVAQPVVVDAACCNLI